MTCPTCGAAARPDQRFCADCGARLERTCGTCGAPLPGEARFCPACGSPADPLAGPSTAAVTRDARSPGDAAGRGPGHQAPVALPVRPAALSGPSGTSTSAGGTPQAERRLVSVLFCDLVGFTGASEARDAEQTRELLLRLLRAGTGAGRALRRHASRSSSAMPSWPSGACPSPTRTTPNEPCAPRSTSWRPCPAWRPELAARAAVVSGEAAVTLGAEGQGMVAGDLVNTASRLQGHAEAGTVLVAESTRLATERAVVYEPVGPASLKGKVLPVDAWRAVRVRPGIGGRLATDELEPPFVGRERRAAHAHRDVPRDGPREPPAPRLGDGPGRHRQEPPLAGARGLPRRHPPDGVLAPRALPGLRRGAHLLGHRGDDPPPRRHRRDRRPGADRRAHRGDARRVRPRAGRARTHRAGRAGARGPRHARLGGHRDRRALRCLAHALRAHRRAGPRGPGLRGHAVGRRRPRRLHRAPPGVVAEHGPSSS